MSVPPLSSQQSMQAPEGALTRAPDGGAPSNAGLDKNAPWRKCVTIGAATLYFGCAYEIMPVLAREFDPDDTVGVMDPPYEMNTSGGGKMRKARPYLDEIHAKGLDLGFDTAVLDGPEGPWCASAFVFCHEDQGKTLFPALAGRFPRVSICGWQKTNPAPYANKAYLADMELCLHAGEDEGVYFHGWRGAAHPRGPIKAKSRFWKGPVGKSEWNHPTVKPLGLMQKIMKNAASGRIVDPFMGTGTTGVAAICAGRVFIGVEKDPDYFRIACKRIADALKWRKIQGNLKAPGKEDQSTEGVQEGFLLGDAL